MSLEDPGFRIIFTLVCIRIFVIVWTNVYLCASYQILVNAPTSVSMGKQGVTFSCSYLHNNSDPSFILRLLKKDVGEATYSEIGRYEKRNGTCVVNTNFTSTAAVTCSRDVLVVHFKEVVCSDEGDYACSANGKPKKHFKFIVTGQVPPLQPTLIISPLKEVVTMTTDYTITCAANVGKPPGVIWWFHGSKGVEKNVTDMASETEFFKSDEKLLSCTYERTSVLNIQLDLSDTIRCKVIQLGYTSSDNIKDCSDVCRQFQSKSLAITETKEGDKSLFAGETVALLVTVLSSIGTVVVIFMLILYIKEKNK